MLLHLQYTLRENETMMEKLGFLIGRWNLDYRIPQSRFSHATTGSGEGTFRRAVHDKVILFDYTCLIEGEKGAAHGVFAWDEKVSLFRYWWFESSGATDSASCNLIDDSTLYMNWHNSVLRQTFRKIDDDTVVLHMDHPNADGDYDLVLEVILNRKPS